MSNNLFNNRIASSEKSALILSGRSFSTTTTLTSVSGSSETDYLLFRNPVGSGKTVFINYLNMGVDSATSRLVARLYYSPTITAVGTLLTSANDLVGASPVASSLVYRSPTISVRGTIVASFIISGTQDSGIIEREFAIQDGSNILVTVHNSIANTQTKIDAGWCEVTI